MEGLPNIYVHLRDNAHRGGGRERESSRGGREEESVQRSRREKGVGMERGLFSKYIKYPKRYPPKKKNSGLLGGLTIDLWRGRKLILIFIIYIQYI